MALLGLLCPAAHAHALLQHAEPPVGSTVQGSPATVSLTFSEAIEIRFSSVIVSDAGGTPLDRRDLHGVQGDRMTVAVGLPPLPPGRYTVTWHAVSVDTHRTEGTFTFTVAP